MSIIVAGGLLIQPRPVVAGLSFLRGIPTAVGCVQFSSSPDSVTITGAYTDPGVIDTTLNIPANRIQYDVINCDQGTMNSWTINYAATVGPSMIGAFTPLGYVTLGGAYLTQGGAAYTTLFNAGYGIYNYNTGAPWTIDYEVDHITFTANTSDIPIGLPANDGVGELAPAAYLPSFAILYNPSLGDGLVPASAVVGTATFNGQVYGPVPGSSCLTVQCSNITVLTCGSCAPATFSATAIDTCCSAVTLVYNPPETTCFPVNTSTTVEVLATDSCGNSATNFFSVTVLPGNCPGNPCITLQSSNILVYTCSNCAVVPYNVTATDNCCSNVSELFNPPKGTCFPVNTSTPVTVIASDACGSPPVTNVFTVTVLPGDCNTNCIHLIAPNVVAYTCSNCTEVPYNVIAIDRCCTASTNVTLLFYPSTNTCFPINSTNVVTVTAFDQCGYVTIGSFLVIVLPGPNCGESGGPGGLLTVSGNPGTGGSGSGTITLNWPPLDVQLQQSSDLTHWSYVQGVTNPPYTTSNKPPHMYYKLQFYPTN